MNDRQIVHLKSLCEILWVKSFVVKGLKINILNETQRISFSNETKIQNLKHQEEYMATGT